jgi:hypothetical protein
MTNSKDESVREIEQVICLRLPETTGYMFICLFAFAIYHVNNQDRLTSNMHGIACNLICFSLLCRRSCRRSGRKVEKQERGYLIRLYRPDNKSEKNWVPTLLRALMNERSCFCWPVLREASGVWLDDAGVQPDYDVFVMGGWQPDDALCRLSSAAAWRCLLCWSRVWTTRTRTHVRLKK